MELGGTWEACFAVCSVSPWLIMTFHSRLPPSGQWNARGQGILPRHPLTGTYVLGAKNQ